MSFDHILNKLAEKHILAGNKDFAYRLVEASEKECSHCGDKSAEMMKRKSKHFCPKCSKQTKCALKGCEAKMMHAEMHKQGGKVYCSKDCAKADKMKKTALDDMIEKYAGKSEEGSYKDAIKEVPGFSGMFGNGFCFNTKEQASKALAIAEQAVNFLNWKVERHDDGFMVISRGKDKEASVLKSMLNKYANDPYTGSPGFEYELEDYGQEYGFKGQDEQDQEELLRKEELEHRDYDQGYSAGYNDGFNKGYNDGLNADPYPMSYNPGDRGLY